MYRTPRQLTRDLLLSYDFSIVPPHPIYAGLNYVYPWENISLMSFSKQFLQLAVLNGFSGNEKELWEHFEGGIILYSNIIDFPEIGNEKNLYLDSNSNIIYCFNFLSPESAVNIEEKGGIITGHSQDETIFYAYLPLRTLLIEDTILKS